MNSDLKNRVRSQLYMIPLSFEAASHAASLDLKQTDQPDCPRPTGTSTTTETQKVWTTHTI